MRFSSSTTFRLEASTISAICVGHRVSLHDRERPSRADRRGACRPVRRGLPPGRGCGSAADRREPGADDRDERARNRGGAGQGEQEEEEGAVASTSEVYGPRASSPFARMATWCWARPPRGAGATRARRRSTSFWRWLTGGAEAPTVIARLFNTVGPRQTGQYGMVVPTFVKQALTGRPITIHGDGSQSRCFTHVSTWWGLIELMDHPGGGG